MLKIIGIDVISCITYRQMTPMRTLLVLLFALGSVQVMGQIGFTAAQSTSTEGFRSGCAIVSTDMNGDGLDDLVRLSNGRVVNVDLQYADATFHNIYQHTVSTYPRWNIIAGDLNGDGRPDIATGGTIQDVTVLSAVPFSSDYSVYLIDDTPFLAQGANIADANGDGHQDIFVCSDHGYNRMYVNDGNGGFDRNDTLIDFNTVPPSDNSGNYGSIWTDFDMDNDLDLYISKCRAGVWDLSDPRRINVLFVNTDTGYVEMADSVGLASAAQSWSSDFADIDNDGDFDVVVINHDYPSELFESIEGDTFIDITDTAGISITGNTIQSIFRDFDNDGYVDLLVSGADSKLYRNLGDNTFEEVTDPFGGDEISSFTIGDFNGDGFPDVYAAYNDLYNTPSDETDDRIWLNNGNDNHYVRIKLIGTDTNTDAIGAKLLLYADTLHQIREIRAGESYGIGTSLIRIFGLGTTSAVDSLVVIWPNGDRQTHTTVPVDTTMSVVQDGCLKEIISLNQGPFLQCGTDTFTLTAPSGYDSYLWSNGDTTQTIQVSDHGLYHVSLTDTAGCLTITDPATVTPCYWASKVVYVDSSAVGDNCGENWQNAFTDLQSALAVADSFYVNIEQVWVAKGTYHPTSGTDRTASFVLVDSVEIYGGFNGNETSLDERNISLHPTRLSGDIGITSDSADNSYHVVVCPDSVSRVLLDGVTIQHGHADGLSIEQKSGAGIYCLGEMSVHNSTLQACHSIGSGTYIFNTGSVARLILNGCQIPAANIEGILNTNNASLIIEGVNQVQK